MSILSQNAAESITSMDDECRDPGWGGVRGGKRSERSCLMESPLRPVFVIEGFELAQRVQKVVLVPDQRPVQQFAPTGLDPSLHDRIHARYPDSALNDADSSIDQHGIEGRGERGVSVPYQEPGSAAGLLQELLPPSGGVKFDHLRHMREIAALASSKTPSKFAITLAAC
ncbi:hypothetical protein GCM10022419_062230 [Nonomuraea rosea]|uniref:Uncharacterized protein n=1 Tax=Nonomuraea rosea TaxID=638574 RepID=A0ABP6XWC4_9ACTN